MFMFQVRPFYEKRMGQELEADTLGDEFKGYVVRITGGNDKQGFPMKQGILTNGRVRLLLKKGTTCYRPRKDVSILKLFRLASIQLCMFRESERGSLSAGASSTETYLSFPWPSSRRERLR